MGLHDVAGNCQPQPRAAPVPRPRPVRLVEPLEHPGQVDFRDAHARVTHLDDHRPRRPAALALLGHRRRHQHLPAPRRKLDRVVHQIRHHLPHPLGVDHNRRQVRRQVHRQRQPPRLRLRPQPLHRPLHQLGRRRRGQPQPNLPRLDLRQLRQLLHHLRQGIDLGPGLLQKALGRRRVVHRPVLQRLHHGPQRGQRRSQLVRQIADEVSPHHLQAPHLRQILEQHQKTGHPLAPERRQHRLQKQFGADLHRLDLLALLATAALPQLDERVVAHYGGERPPQRRLLARVQQATGGRVDQQHHARLVGDDHPVGHVVDDRGKAAITLVQALDLLALALGHLAEGLHQVADLVAALRQHAGRRVPGGDAARHGGDVLQRLRQARGDDPRQQQHPHQGQPGGDQHRAPHAAGAAQATRARQEQVETHRQQECDRQKGDGDAPVELGDHGGRLTVEAIADAAHGDDARRRGRVGLHLLAQPAHVDIDCAAVAVECPVPHPFQNQIAR